MRLLKIADLLVLEFGFMRVDPRLLTMLDEKQPESKKVCFSWGASKVTNEPVFDLAESVVHAAGLLRNLVSAHARQSGFFE